MEKLTAASAAAISDSVPTKESELGICYKAILFAASYGAFQTKVYLRRGPIQDSTLIQLTDDGYEITHQSEKIIILSW